jgi:hypothetical protein
MVFAFFGFNLSFPSTYGSSSYFRLLMVTLSFFFLFFFCICSHLFFMYLMQSLLTFLSFLSYFTTPAYGLLISKYKTTYDSRVPRIVPTLLATLHSYSAQPTLR